MCGMSRTGLGTDEDIYGLFKLGRVENRWVAPIAAYLINWSAGQYADSLDPVANERNLQGIKEKSEKLKDVRSARSTSIVRVDRHPTSRACFLSIKNVHVITNNNQNQYTDMLYNNF
jgi:hypothetical protein